MRLSCFADPCLLDAEDPATHNDNKSTGFVLKCRQPWVEMHPFSLILLKLDAPPPLTPGQLDPVRSIPYEYLCKMPSFLLLS